MTPVLAAVYGVLLSFSFISFVIVANASSTPFDAFAEVSKKGI